MSDLTGAVFFTKSTGLPAEGLTLADIDLYLTEQDKATGVDTVIWDGTQHPTEEIDNIGAYTRIYASADIDANYYFLRGTYTGVTVLDVDHVTGTNVASEVATSDAQIIADEVLKRGVSNVEDDADDTSLAVLLLAAFESAIANTVWTIRKTGGDTKTTKTVTVDATASPITGVT